MAHAGTPTDLAKQPAAPGSWSTLLTAIVILAIGVGMVMAVPFITGGRATTAPAVDRGYDAIEKARGAWALSGVTVDTSYDAIENLRALSGVTVDSSAAAKAAAAKARAMSGVPVDTSYQDLTARGAHGQLP